MKRYCIIIVLLVVVFSGYCQEPNMPEYQKEAPSALGISENAIMSLGILLAGLLIIICEIVFINIVGKQLQMDGIDAIRLITVTLIIFAALFVANGSYPESGTAAVTGLLGTLAGYLLARSAQIGNKTEHSDSSEPVKASNNHVASVAGSTEEVKQTP